MDNTIRVQRAMHRLTQQQLAAKIGVRVQTINAIENNKNIPNLRVAMRISDYFKIPVDQLFVVEKKDIQVMPKRIVRKSRSRLAENYTGVRVMPYRHADLCKFYQLSGNTMRKCLLPIKEELGIRMGQYYNPRQVRIIFERLGVPETNLSELPPNAGQVVIYVIDMSYMNV